MRVKVCVQLDRGKIAQLQRAQTQALEMTAEAMKSDIVSNQVVPKEHGDLERSGFVDISQISQGRAGLGFDTPYARRLYWHPEYNFRTDKNPNAQGLWMQSYIDGPNADFARENYIKFLKQQSRGLIT
jgi:hypothetical protein